MTVSKLAPMQIVTIRNGDILKIVRPPPSLAKCDKFRIRTYWNITSRSVIRSIWLQQSLYLTLLRSFLCVYGKFSLKTLILNGIVKKLFDTLPPTSVTFYLQIVIVIQLDPPPTYLDTVTKYSDFFFWRAP